ncbi:MAG: DNA repair protein RecN [Rhodobacteraceae bacterium]|nr:DNA repair protein RecN [Paracoccaceae bacterium]
MLSTLSIRDMLLIERLELAFQPGLNALTGETGAGKSILLDSLGFVLGWRGRADLVREGAQAGEVVAEFDLAAGHPAFAVLDEAGIPAEGELILRRTVAPDGRKQAYVNDRRCSAEMLRQISDTLVELHGQHDDRGLLNARGHRALLDTFSGAEAELGAVRGAWEAMASLKKVLARRRDEVERAARDRDFLIHSVAELDDLAPEPGEDGTLDARRRLMQAGQRIREDIAKAAAALGADGADGLIGDAQRWLQGVAGQAEGRLEAPLEALARGAEDLAQALRGVEDCLDALDFDPGELERVEERLFAIRALARKHGVAPDDLGDFAARIRADLEAVEGGAEGVKKLEAEVAAAEAAYGKAAAAMSAVRGTAAARLDAAMAAELAPLKLERAVFRTEVETAEAGPDGTDLVRFTVATNPGAPAGPLDRIASGGELSRFLLALKVCLTARQEGLSMIFDEIDRGVGGATADAVGRRLARLAEGGQILVVTHSPQVAALAGHHWVVEKSSAGGKTVTQVSPLNGAARTAEIARMLAGERITDEARAAAEVLLKAG